MVNLKEYIKKTKNEVSKKAIISDKVQTTLLVAAIGGGTGLAIASAKNKSLILYGLIGATIGILALNFVNYKKD